MKTFWKRIAAGALAGVVALGISVPAYALDGGGSGGGATDIPQGSSNTVVEQGAAAWEVVANQTKEVTNSYKNGKKSESKDKGAGAKKSYPSGINPRGFKHGGIKVNYSTVCVNYAGYYRHNGPCSRLEINYYDYRSTKRATSFDATMPRFTYDMARTNNPTRVTSKSSVSGNPGVSCTASKSSTSNGVTTTNTLRSMSYSVKYISFDKKGVIRGSNSYGISTPRFSTESGARAAVYNAEKEVQAAYNEMQSRTASWRSSGYSQTSEASGGKSRIGCYYNTKMSGKATAWFGSAKCVVGYKVNVVDERTGKVVATKSEKTAYGKSPSFSNCKGGLYAKINVSDLVPNGFGKWRYDRVLTYDNPQVDYSPNGGWSLKNTLKNTSTETNVFYIRATCNPDWNGIWKSPQSDTVTKNGKNYNISYSQQDCSSGTGTSTTQCAMPSQGNSDVGVIVSNSIGDYNTAKNTVADDGKVTVVRNGVEQHLKFTIPKVGVSEAYKSYFSGALPKNLSITLSNIAKNVDGTPWNNNTDVRSGVPLNKANLADFVVKKTGDSSWIAKIAKDASITSFTGGEKYYVYKVADGATNDVTIASRWESTEGKPTVLRSDYTVKGDFPYKKWTVSAIGPNGVPSSAGTTIAYATSSLRCVSGPTEVETVRSVS